MNDRSEEYGMRVDEGELRDLMVARRYLLASELMKDRTLPLEEAGEERFRALRKHYADICEALSDRDTQTLWRLKAEYDALPEEVHLLLHPWAQVPRPTPEELLEELSRKGKLGRFLQVDVRNHDPSYERSAGELKHHSSSKVLYDLRTGPYSPLRVQIHELATMGQVVSMLLDLSVWIAQNWDFVTGHEGQLTSLDRGNRGCEVLEAASVAELGIEHCPLCCDM